MFFCRVVVGVCAYVDVRIGVRRRKDVVCVCFSAACECESVGRRRIDSVCVCFSAACECVSAFEPSRKREMVGKMCACE